jgi:hypothetical protein
MWHRFGCQSVVTWWRKSFQLRLVSKLDLKSNNPSFKAIFAFNNVLDIQRILVSAPSKYMTLSYHSCIYFTLCLSYLNPYCMGRITAFFQRVFKFTHYDKSALEHLEGQATFKFRAFWSIRGGKGLTRQSSQHSKSAHSSHLLKQLTCKLRKSSLRITLNAWNCTVKQIAY